MVSKRPDGPYPYIGTGVWSERLADAIENTCAQEGIVPPPRTAIIEGLATALGETEIKKIVVTSRGKKFLSPTAWRVVQSGDDKVLLLLCDVHGGAVVPWELNDRTVSCWAPPSPGASQLVVDLVTAEAEVESAAKVLKLAEKERDIRRLAPGDDRHAAAALAAAEEKFAQATKHSRAAERTKAALLAALGQRRPRPVVHAAEENGEAKTALVLPEQPYEVAFHIHGYAVSSLRRSGKTRGYDLAESLVSAGQLTRGMSVLQQWQVTRADGSTSRLWRMVAVTANNRALARLDVFGIKSEYLVTGMPQAAVPVSKGPNDVDLLLLNQREILNRVSYSFNEASALENIEPDHRALRALKIATVPTEIVVGCTNPAALEHVLRALNVNDHLRGIQPYDEEARLIALFATLVDAYLKDNKLGPVLADAFPTAQGTDLMDLGGVRDALTGNGPLDPLAALLPSDEKVSPVTLRDMAIRAITALVFPDVPPAGPKTGKRQVRDTGEYWPVVRGALEEAPLSQVSAKTAQARTKLWSAAVALLFLHRANILSALGMFGTTEVKEGHGQDPRALKELLLGAEAGDVTAWTALVQRMAPGLIHTPESLITPGQGSEAGEGRKGVRRTPPNALAALKLAYTDPGPGVSRQLLLAFARSVLQHPDATEPPEAPGGGLPVCFGETHLAEEDRTPIVPGMILVPDLDGAPTGFVADKEWFDRLFPVELAQSGASHGGAAGAQADSEDDDEAAQATTVTGQTPPTDPHDRLAELRRGLLARIELAAGNYQRAIEAAAALLSDFDEASRLRDRLGEEPLPADQRIQWMEQLASARAKAQESAGVLGQAETLILQV